jgi:hypothetical protein
VRVMLRARMTRAALERALGALEIAALGVATSVAAFMLGLDEIPVLMAIYFATVVVAYALACCIEAWGLPQAGND